MASITVQPELLLERILSLEIVRVTERAAVSSARLRGHGKEKASDQAAVDAMRRELNKLPIDGTVVIGEGEMDEAPMLFIGEKVGNRTGPKVDIAVDPLEGTTLCAKNMPGAIATLAMADAGTLLHAPDCYMDKIAIGPGYPKGTIDLDAPPTENILSLAKAKGVKPSEITAILLDRPRHADIIAAVRKTGAAVSLISDGDVAGVIHCADPKTGIDIYLGIGGAPEGVLAASALRCIGEVGGQAVLGRQDSLPTPWLTERLGYDPTWQTGRFSTYYVIAHWRVAAKLAKRVRDATQSFGAGLNAPVFNARKIRWRDARLPADLLLG